MIYHYIFGNMVIAIVLQHSFTGIFSPVKEHYRFIAREDNSESPPMNVKCMIGFIFACRKLYAEARLLPFQLSVIDEEYISRTPILLRLLADAQRDAISTIRYKQFPLKHSMGPRAGPSAMALGSFKGLKRVIVKWGSDSRELSERMREALTVFLRAASARNEGLEVLMVKNY